MDTLANYAMILAGIGFLVLWVRPSSRATSIWLIAGSILFPVTLLILGFVSLAFGIMRFEPESARHASAFLRFLWAGAAAVNMGLLYFAAAVQMRSEKNTAGKPSAPPPGA